MSHLLVQLLALATITCVAMVKAAPQPGGEQLGDQSLPAVKRAEEEIYFGNQQNEARGMRKKSSPYSPLYTAAKEEPLVDMQAQLESHQETPVEKDLALRAEIAKGKSLDQSGDEAYEYAMQQAVQNVLHKVDEKMSDSQTSDVTGQEANSAEDDSSNAVVSDSNTVVSDSNAGDSVNEAVDSTDSKVSLPDDVAREMSEEVPSIPAVDTQEPSDSETDEKSGDSATPEVVSETNMADAGSDAAGETSDDVNGEQTDSTETSDVSSSEAADGTQSEAESTSTDDVTVDREDKETDPVTEAEQFRDEERILQDIPYTMEYREERLLPPAANEQLAFPRFLGQLKNGMYKAPTNYGQAPLWMSYKPSHYNLPQNPSAHDSRRRRIKRDLLDDEFGVPYSQYSQYMPPASQYIPPSPSQYIPPSPSLNDPSDPWSDDDVDYVYKLFLNYLEEKAEEELEEEREREILSQLPLWGSPDQVPQDTSDVVPEYLPDETADRRPMGEEDFAVPFLPEEEESPVDYEPSYSFDDPGVDESDVIDSRVGERSFDRQVNKRFLSALTQRSEGTGEGWGKFLPEKRSYNEALEKLQRLALALNDNQGGYYSDMMEDYKKR